MAPSFSAADDEVLIQVLATHPALWLMSHAYYKDQRVKDNIWAEIAEKVGKPLDQCKKRWRNIKDTYDRKKNKKTGSAATPTKIGKKWALEEKLSFLRTAEEHRGSFSHLNPSLEQEILVDSPLSCDEQISKVQQTSTSTQTPDLSSCSTLPQYLTTTPRGKRLNREALLVENTEDDVDLFFKSMAKSVKKLPPPLQQMAKTETLNAITRLEREMWKQIQHSSFNNYPQHFLNDTPAIASSRLSSYSDGDSSHQSSTAK